MLLDLAENTGNGPPKHILQFAQRKAADEARKLRAFFNAEDGPGRVFIDKSKRVHAIGVRVDGYASGVQVVSHYKHKVKKPSDRKFDDELEFEIVLSASTSTLSLTNNNTFI